MAADRPRDWRWIAALTAIVLIAVIRVANTHRVFSETLDEPAHLAAGYDWISGAPYTIDPSHPPLERILSALPLKLQNIPRSTASDFIERGNHLLYHGDRYVKNVARMRLGNLLLFALGIVAVAYGARRRFGDAAGLVAAALFTTLPAVLGHAGVATTDLAVAATLPLALLAVDRYLESPSRRRAVELGLAIALGMLSKFSFLVFFPVALFAVVALRWPIRTRLRPLLITVAVTFVAVWAGYRFDTGTIADKHTQGVDYVQFSAPAPLRPAATWIARNVPVPAPLFAVGFLMVKAHNSAGHTAFLLGRYSDTGWWYYFPVIWFFKTPLPYILLLAWGIVLLVRKAATERSRAVLEPLLIALAIMASVMPSSINIGIRHILPIYAPLTAIAAYATVEIWRRATDAFGRFALVTLLVWLFGGVAWSHPDYLAWFNEMAGPNPDRVAVDSNLDWGQDVLRLERAVRERNIQQLRVIYVGNAWLHLHLPGVQVDGMTPYVPYKGWIAVSETGLKLENRIGGYKWLELYRPVTRVGKSIRLYYIP